jgi:hypothetical protein
MANYYRKFYRNGNTPFEDFVSDATYAAANFKDFFGKEWLPSHPDALSFDSVVRPFYGVSQATTRPAFSHTNTDWEQSLDPKQNISFDVFAVADGSIVPSTSDNESWLDQSIRFVAFIAGNEDPSTVASPFDNNGSWTLCVVGSSDVMSKTIFMQTASWDGEIFRYYEVSCSMGRTFRDI